MTVFGAQRIGGFRLASVAAAIALVAGPVSAQKLPAGEYQVGFITETTGPLAAAGISFYRGAQLAAEQVSAEGWLGKGAHLSLVARESGSDAARSVQALNQLAAMQGVLASTCCILSPVVGALRPVAANQKMPLVVHGATKPGLPQKPFVMSMVPLPGNADLAMLREIVATLKPKTVAFFVNGDNEALADRAKDGRKLLEAAGVRTTAVLNVLTADTDFTAPATQAMAGEPDLIVVMATQSASVGAITTLRARGYKGQIAGIDVLAPAPVFKRAGQAIAGVPFPVVFTADLAGPEVTRTFVDTYAKKFGEPPDSYSAQGYSAITFIAQALRGFDARPSRQALADAMQKVTSLDKNPYGGATMVEGQVEVANAITAAWSTDGKTQKWQAAK